MSRYLGRNVILGDEMGLGKTAQTVAAKKERSQRGDACGPSQQAYKSE